MYLKTLAFCGVGGSKWDLMMRMLCFFLRVLILRVHLRVRKTLGERSKGQNLADFYDGV